MAKKVKKKRLTKEQQRNKIFDVFTDQLHLLRMSGYSILVLRDGDAGYEQPEHNSFAVSVQHPYKTIKLFCDDSVFEYGDVLLRKMLLHEAVHVMMWRYSRLAESRFCGEDELEDEDEHLTDHITNVITGLI